MFPIDYYSIERASEFLSEKLNQPISRKDVIRFAANDKIRFCVHIEDHLSKFSIVEEVLKCDEERYGFDGVVRIPHERISPIPNKLIPPDRDVITFSTIEQIVEIERLYDKRHDPRLIGDGAWLGKVKPKERHQDKTEQIEFVVHLHEVIIPEKDLIDFIEKTGRCVELESISILGQNKSIGRPKSIEKNARVLKQIIESLTDVKKINPTELPGSADNLLEACKRIAQAKSRKNMFSISLDAFKKWLKATGYGFGNGRTPANEKNYWTNLGAKNIEKIDQKVFY